MERRVIVVVLALGATVEAFRKMGGGGLRTARIVVARSALEEDPTVTKFDLPDKIVALESDKYGFGREASIMKVLAVQAPQYCKVREDQMVIDAVKAMNLINKGSSIVVDAEDRIKGIFTERDFIKKVVEQNKKSGETLITDVMTPREVLITADSDMSVGQCMEMMLSNNIRHLPVLDQDGEDLLGLVATTDLVKTIKQDDEMLDGQYSLRADYDEIIAQNANRMALESDLGKQDISRGLFVLAGAITGAFLLQGSYVHNHYEQSMVAIFVLGYIGIIFESLFEFNKAAIALLMATGLWVTYAGTAGATGAAIGPALDQLREKVAEVSEVIYFLVGAMTIVEIVDAHRGFKVVTDFIKTNTKRSLFWVLGAVAFVMSAILDNLTTTIVMVSLLKKLVPSSRDRMLFGSLIVIAANAGGAWTPIGDVTTTMLWINGQITAISTMKDLFLPSVVSTLVSAAALTPLVKEDEKKPQSAGSSKAMSAGEERLAPRGFIVFITGLLGLVSVPIFKSLTGLPPYFGMLSSLGVLWILTDAVHADEEKRSALRVPEALSKIDTSGVLFFLGILLSVGALDAAGLLRELSSFLNEKISSIEIVATAIGAVSAIIDNVPLVAASMGMYSLNQFPPDDRLWQLIAFCAGTGGSMLVIGSAAGVALMGLEKVDFIWYAKNISLGAAAGYVAGIVTYLLTHTDVLSALSQFAS